jgi:hypothetical protein
MPTIENYRLIKQLIDANANETINAYFRQAEELVATSNYSLDQLINAANRQIDISNEVLETGETFTGNTTQGRVSVTPEEAQQNLEEGLWLLISLYAYGDYAELDFEMPSTNTNNPLVDAVIRFQNKISQQEIDRVRGNQENEEDEEDLDDIDLEYDDEREARLAPVEEPKAPVYYDKAEFFPNRQVQLAHKALQSNREVFIKTLDEKYNLNRLFEQSKTIFKDYFDLLDIENSDFVYNFNTLIQNSKSLYTNLNVFLEAINILSAMQYHTERYVYINEDIIFDIWGENYPSRSNIAISSDYINRLYALALLLFQSEGKGTQFLKEANIFLNRQDMEQIYTEIVEALAENFIKYEDLESQELTLDALKDNERLKQNLTNEIDSQSIKKQLKDQGQAIKQYSPINFKGW